MNEETLKEFITEKALAAAVSDAEALRPELAGMRVFDAPIFAAATADDPMFLSLRADASVGGHHCMPADWTPDARSVLSVFFPFAKRVRAASAAFADRQPAAEWLHGRIEGQNHISAISAAAAEALRGAGFSAVAPSVANGFRSKGFTSNWSERHIAFVCGLGTFGLSRGLITEKGVAGRFCSIVTSMELGITHRGYTELYEHCIFCGLCAKRCPAEAIDPKTGKAHGPCGAFLSETRELFAPRYGCGKCQVGVPCEGGIPAKGAGR
ncbi:MAG: 4Fe-4S binding protein [Clostridiales Family XIII bacterium]|jgi:epoxyqueuosine reductase QueG|nr:4Fe-4S binding protein [Clostridiales Family XIII bacterium]